MAEIIDNRPKEKLPGDTLILVMGILSIVGAFCCAPLNVIFGIIGWVKGNSSRGIYENDPNTYLASSFSNVKTGRLLSIIGIVLGIVFAIWSWYYVSSNPEILDMYRELLEGAQESTGGAGSE